MSDSDLICRVLQGNTACYREIVLKYQQHIFRLCMGFTHCKEDAEDLCQEAFINAFRSLNRFKGQSEFSTWLYRIAVNVCLNFRRRANNKRTFLIGGTLDAIDQTVNNQRIQDAPDQSVFEKEIAEALHTGIALLPEKQRVAFILFHYQMLPQKEVAAVLGSTTGAVEQLLQRAKGHLRKKLQVFYRENVRAGHLLCL